MCYLQSWLSAQAEVIPLEARSSYSIKLASSARELCTEDSPAENMGNGLGTVNNSDKKALHEARAMM